MLCNIILHKKFSLFYQNQKITHDSPYPTLQQLIFYIKLCKIFNTSLC